MDLFPSIIEACEVSSPEKEIPIELRSMAPKVIKDRNPWPLIFAVYRGGTFTGAA